MRPSRYTEEERAFHAELGGDNVATRLVHILPLERIGLTPEAVRENWERLQTAPGFGPKCKRRLVWWLSER